MPYDRDVQAFHDRAPGYEAGYRGRMHHDIAARTADLALGVEPTPRCVLDVGCGTGVLLRLLAERRPDTEQLAGIDAAEGMISVATSTAHDSRISFSTGVAEELPYPDDSFDLIVSTTSFDHWQDQRVGLAQCFRVLAPGGHFVLTDLFSLWLTPTLIRGHRHMARHRLPYAAEHPFGSRSANLLVTGRHRPATCPMQCRATLIGGREIRPRNLWITRSAVQETAGHGVAPMQRGARRHS